MQIDFWNINKKINSTKHPAPQPVMSSSFIMKENASVINPIIILRIGSSMSGFITDANYAYISDFGRYYYITDKILINKQEMEIHLKTDSLANARSLISQYSGQIARTSNPNQYNLNVVDNFLTPTTGVVNSQVVTASVSEGAADFTPFGGSYSFTVYGDEGAEIYNSRDTIDNITSDLFDDPSLWGSFLAGQTNPAQYVSSFVYIPLRYSNYDDPHVHVGTVATQLSHAEEILNNSDRTKLILKIFTIPTLHYEDFRDFDERFTHATIKAPFIGTVAIPASSLRADSINLAYYVDMATGSGIAQISAVKSTWTSSQILNRISFFCGVQTPIGASTFASDKALSVINSGLSAASSVASVASGNVSGAFGAIGAIANVINDGAIGEATGWQNVTCIGSTGSFADYGDMSCNLYIIQQGSTSNSDDEKGRPARKAPDTPVLNNYYEYSRPILNSNKLTKTEIDEVIALMQSGFYYE